MSEKELKYIINESVKKALMDNSCTIAIDFDGTVVKHEYPYVGEDIGAVPVLKELVKNGHKLILSTMRSSRPIYGMNTLQDAVDWFDENGIPLYGVQAHPTQNQWTDSPKCHASFCIDDRNMGTPLTSDEEGNRFVDWNRMRELLEEEGLI